MKKFCPANNVPQNENRRAEGLNNFLSHLIFCWRSRGPSKNREAGAHRADELDSNNVGDRCTFVEL